MRAAIFALLIGGCVPSPPDGAIRCALSGAKLCPDGYQCAGDQTCRRNLDAGVPLLDGAVGDFASSDLSGWVKVTVTRAGASSSDGLVASSDGTINCGTSCVGAFPVGAQVTLTASATPRKGAWFSGFTGAGCGAAPSCSFTAVADVTITAQFDTANYMFVTSMGHSAVFGADRDAALTAADGFCAQLASLGGLPSNSYVAWLSTTRVDAIDHVTAGGARGWLRPDDRPFADKIPPLDNDRVFYPPIVDENGNRRQSGIFSGTSIYGRLNGGANCNDFTSTGPQCINGNSSAGARTWTQLGPTGCNMPLSIYCFGTQHKTPIAPSPAPGARVGFVSATSFDPMTGLAAADTICRTEAGMKAFASPNSFLAALGTATSSVKSRFNLTAPWARPDGILLAATAADLFDPTVSLAPIDQRADRSFAGGVAAWTGGSPTATPAVSQTCGDWTQRTTGTGISGLIGVMVTQWDQDNGTPEACAPTNYEIYCLQN